MVGRAEKRKPGRPKKLPAKELVIRTALRDNLDKIVDAFVKQAMEGSCAHFKLICELLEKSEARVERDPARELLAKWRRQEHAKNFNARESDGRFVSASPKDEVGNASGADATATREILEG